MFLQPFYNIKEKDNRERQLCENTKDAQSSKLEVSRDFMVD